MKKYTLFILVHFVVLFSASGFADYISNVRFDPLSPAAITFNQNVNISFDYNTTLPGVRIFARPLTNGIPTPNYAASGSPVYPSGTGSGSGSFTITSGEVEVDQIVFTMLDENQTHTLIMFYVDVSFIFSNHSIFSITINPIPPNSLQLNQDVTVNFSYSTNEAGGVRIFARPFTDGALSPMYAASGSGVYPVGTGVGIGTFTITTGMVNVDSIRFQMYNENQSTLLLEFFLPVDFTFGDHSISGIILTPVSPASLAFNSNVNISFNYSTNQAGGVRIFARPFSGGALTPNYSASGSGVYPAGNGTGFGSFSITSGDAVVDQLRFQILDDAQTSILYEGFFPVTYTFTSHSISNIILTPTTSAGLSIGSDVNISFDYSTTEPGGVRIFARPFTNGNLSSNYGAHGSILYPVGNGTGTGFFALYGGSDYVDQIRFQMYDDLQTQLLLEFFIPVYYYYFQEPFAIDPINGNLPKDYSLDYNYPNPFNAQTSIMFSLPEKTLVNIKIYDILGKEICELVNEERSPGFYEVSFNAEDLMSGVYFYKITAGNFSDTKKMILLK